MKNEVNKFQSKRNDALYECIEANPHWIYSIRIGENDFSFGHLREEEKKNQFEVILVDEETLEYLLTIFCWMESQA